MAKVVVRNALTPLPTSVDYRGVPWVTFTDPEVARVGMAVEEAAAAGERPQVFRSDFAELDRAIVEGESATAGFCKVVTRPNGRDRKSTRLNSSHLVISYAVFCLKKKTERS